MDDLRLSILLFVAVLTVTCGAQQLLSKYKENGEKFSKMVFYNNSLYIGGNQHMYKFKTTKILLNPEEKESICTESCVSNVNKILLVNSIAKELIECSSGDRGICKMRDLETLKLKRNSSNIVTIGDGKFEEGLTVSTDIEWPAQAHLTETSTYLVIAITNGSGVSNANKMYFPISMWPVNSGQKYKIEFKEKLDNYRITYVSTFRFSHYSYFFTNQMQLPNRKKMVSKVVRLNQNFINVAVDIFKSYTDFVIDCKDNTGKQYTTLKNAILLHINGTPTVAATFTTESSDDGSILCTKPLDDINKQAVESWIYFILNCPITNGSYFKEDCGPLNANRTGTADYIRTELQNSTNPHNPNFFHSMDWSVLHMEYVASSTSQEGIMVTIHDSVLNGRHVLLVGTSTGSVLQFVYTDGTYMRYNRFEVQDSPILGLYQHNDIANSLFVLTKNELNKYVGTQCVEYAGNHCMNSNVMKGKNPLCGWCIYEQRASLQSDCSCNKTGECWRSSLTSCILLDIEPKGATSSSGTVNIQLTPSLSLPDGQYFCRWQNETVKNATKKGSNFSCSMENKNVANNIQLTLEFGVKVDNKEILLTEAPFLIYHCSNFKKCGECITTVGPNCTWCRLEGKCVLPNADYCSQFVTESPACPQLANHSDQLYIPSGVNQSMEININNKISDNIAFRLIVDDLGLNSSCHYVSSQLSCPVIGSVNGTKAKMPISMQYLSTRNVWVYLDDNHNNSVTIYNCAKLAEGGCNYCKALNTARYKCAWDKTNGCMFKKNVTHATCGAPTITKISPNDGPYSGTVKVNLTGDEFGLVETEPIVGPVTVSGKSCEVILKNITYVPDDPLDFILTVRTGFRCQATGPDVSGNSTKFFISGQEPILKTRSLILKNSTITHVYPVYGPRAGGTKITLYGENLGIGNRDLNTLEIQNKGLIGANVVNNSKGNDDYVIIGEIPTGNFTGNETFVVSLNDVDISPKNVTFSFLVDPVIKNIAPDHGFLSGGTILTVSGDNLGNAQLPRVFIQNYEAESSESCFPAENSSQILYCKVPIAPADIKTILNSGRQKRSTTDCQDCKEVTIVVKLDGIEKTFTLKYYHDPSLSKFTNGMQLFNADDQFLTVNGDNIRFLKNSDVNITIGIEQCRVVQIEQNSMKCVAPRTQPKPGIQGAEYPEVNITIGNINQTLGQLQYQKDLNTVVIIAGAVGGAVFFVAVLAFILICYKLRKTKSKAKELEGDLNKLEMEIKSVARQEFLDMHTTMSTVNRKLIEQGFPYHNYQQYSCNVLFASDYLLSEPVVSSHKMTDNMRSKFKEGMKKLEALLENKLFLTSLIGTMEKQKSFFLRDKSNLAGNLCAIMMGRMDYLHEVLEVILANLVQETSGKRGMKTLFRRCESITEKILSNWLLLCMYPHLKNHTGSPLYLLYMATRKTIESGPIDALTNDSKFTLTEDKLLKKYEGSCDTPDSRDVKFEAKTLTLNVVVGKSEEIFPCKALDCDTITQVKVKCLDQIYVNYPASQMGIDPKDLILEWHAGFGGHLVLKDRDNTSTQEGQWVRLNTLAHYSVSDQSNMALVDPTDEDLAQMEDYVNLAQINASVDNHSMESDSPLTGTEDGHDVENPALTKPWHLVKKDEENTKQEKSAIAELYLNRLLTTKQSLLQYIKDLMDEVLDSNKCPLPAQFLFQSLDNLGETMKADPDTIHAWKSHSFAIRVLACLIQSPGILFDVSIPSYVSENLDIISSQVFIASFGLDEHKFTKDSPSQKLIFVNEVRGYRERVQEFYTNIRGTELNSMDLIQYFSNVNKLQQETTFNKTAALYRFFEQIKPYNSDIMDDLSLNKKTSSLQLDRKLAEIMEMMEEE